MSMSVLFNMEIWVRSISLISRVIPMHIFEIDQYIAMFTYLRMINMHTRPSSLVYIHGCLFLSQSIGRRVLPKFNFFVCFAMSHFD
jgi:hypothetical protein